MSVEQVMGSRRAPTEVTPRVTAGIDWASEEHAVAVVDDQGRPSIVSASRTPDRICAG
jgi:hypothetical protein